ncbi:MAG: hypothetical protein LBG78_04850, partial [Azoarcus sp.]|nr:hypothetical protein [Azoarcus sp.]
MKKYLLPLAAILFLCACSSKSSRLRLDETGTPAFAKNDPRDCARNFSSRVNAQRGRDFATTVFIKNGVPQNFAVNRAVRFMASEGMEIISSDEKTGHISASRVTAKRSRSAAPPPFNVSINTIP